MTGIFMVISRCQAERNPFAPVTFIEQTIFDTNIFDVPTLEYVIFHMLICLLICWFAKSICSQVYISVPTSLNSKYHQVRFDWNVPLKLYFDNLRLELQQYIPRII